MLGWVMENAQCSSSCLDPSRRALVLVCFGFCGEEVVLEMAMWAL